MKNHTRLLSAAASALLPLAAIAAEADKAGCSCCSDKAAQPVKTAFAAPPPAPVASAEKKALGEADQQFLASYERVRAALAGDNFEAARAAAAEIDGGEPIAKAKSIAEARVAFKGLSARAIAKAKGHAGFYVAHCPMVKGGGADWLATKKAIENPYFGSAMFACGYIKE